MKPRQEAGLRKKEEDFYRMTEQSWKLSQGFTLGGVRHLTIYLFKPTLIFSRSLINCVTLKILVLVDVMPSTATALTVANDAGGADDGTYRW